MIKKLYADAAAQVIQDGEKAEDTDGDQASVEVIRNPVVLAAFRCVIERPLMVLIAWHIVLFASIGLATQYNPLKHKPVKWHPLNNKLKSVQEALTMEFDLVGSGSKNNTMESVVIWSEPRQDIRGSREFREALRDVKSALHTVKRSDCEDSSKKALERMTWKSYNPFMPSQLAKRLMSADGSTSLVPIASPCNPGAIKKRLAAIDGKHKGLRVALGSPSSVVNSSVDEASKQVATHMVICAPIMWLLLWWNTGSMLRAATAFVCLLCSYFGTQAVTVLIKWCWPGLDYKAPTEVMLIFVELALCLDYCLFFWTRFSQERSRNPEPRCFEQALMKTLQSSGAVIMVSVSVLLVGNLSMCFYPDQNTLECLSGTIQMIIGISLLGMYSLVIPASLAAYFPSLFDEGSECSCPWFAWPRRLDELRLRVGKTYKGLIDRQSIFVTSWPWIVILPVLVYACLCPLILQLRHFKPNFNLFEASTSVGVPEYEAFQRLTSQFNIGQLEPVLVLLEARPLGPAPALPHRDDMAMLQLRVELQCPNCSATEAGGPVAPELGTSLERAASLVAAPAARSGVTMGASFREMVCRYIGNVVRGTRGREFEIRTDEVQSIWWNGTSGSCAEVAQLQHPELLSASGMKQVLQLYPPVHQTSDGSQAMTRFFWDQIEPQSRSTFDFNGQRYDFQARHLTEMASIMLIQEKYAERAPWIVAVLVVLICIIVGGLFKSIGLGLKMIITVVLPIVAEFGLIVGIYQYGWLEWAGIHRTNGLVWTHLYTTVGLLLGLAIDYDIFLFARVYERRLEGYDNNSAVRLAVAETSSVITVAGTVMCLSFLFVALASIFVISQLGILYLLGVALDTYIIRTILAPSILCISETMNYWPGHVPPVTKSWHADVNKPKA